jgi:hypothetical protein
MQLPVQQRLPPARYVGGESADPAVRGPLGSAGIPPLHPGEMTSFLMNSESFAIRKPFESPVARSPRHPAGRLGAPRGPIGSTTAPPHLYPARLLVHPQEQILRHVCPDSVISAAHSGAPASGASRAGHVPPSVRASFRSRAAVRGNAAWTPVKWSPHLRKSPWNLAH